MESLKGLPTGIHSVPGYSVIFYRVFALPHTPEARHDHSADTNLELLDLAQASLHAADQIVAIDPESETLWLFHNKWDDDVIRDIPQDIKPLVVEGVALQPLCQALLKVAEVPRARLRAAVAAGGKSPTSPSSAAMPNLRTLIRNARAVEANASTGGQSEAGSSSLDLDPSMVLPWFISAVEASVSYQLSKTLGFLPLNSRTWATSNEASRSDPLLLYDEHNESIVLISLDAYVTTAGTLILSFRTTPRPDMHQCSPKSPPDPSQPLRLAPSGILAKVAPEKSLCRLLSRKSESLNRNPQKIRTSRGMFNDHTWRAAVRNWLQQRGIDLERVNPGDGWLAVQLTDDALPTPAKDFRIVECQWPTSLCFYYTPGCSDSLREERTTRAEVEDGLLWFSHNESIQVDPLHRAQDWFNKKAERDKIKEQKRLAAVAAAQQDQVTVPDPNLLYPASPLYSRTDLQAAGGVYPTPPDGILTHPTVNTVASDGSFPLMSASEGPRANDESTELTPSNIRGDFRDDAADHTSPMDADNDLFGDMDMDDDNFGANELSDADFNFFDEPDVDDEIRPNTTEAKAADQAPTMIEEPVEQATVAGLGGGDLAIDTPLAGVDADLPQKRHADVLQSPAPAEESIGDHQSPEPGPMPIECIGETPASTTPEPPLSNPVLSKQQLPLENSGQEPRSTPVTTFKDVARADGRYDNINFHNQMEAADAKYVLGGIFGFSAQSRDPKPRDDKADSKLHQLPSTTAFEQVRRRSTDQHKLSSPRQVAGLRPPIHGTSNLLSLTRVGRLDVVADSDTDDVSSATSAEDDMQWDEAIPSGTPIDARQRKRIKIEDEMLSSAATSPSKGGNEEPQSLDLEYLALDVSKNKVLSLLGPNYADWDISQLPAPEHLNTEAAYEFNSPSFPYIEETDQNSSKLDAKKSSLVSDRVQISVAQLVSEQCALSTLRIIPGSSDRENDLYASAKDSKLTTQLLNQARSALTGTFPDLAPIDIAKYAQVADAPLEPPPGSKLPPRPPPRKIGGTGQGADGTPTSTVFPIQTQHVRVRRGDSLWDLLPPALSFWEPLGLAPASGAKNVLAYCIYPQNDSLVPSLTSFMDMMGSVYDGCKLGVHLRGLPLKGFHSDLIPVQLPDDPATTYETAIRSLRHTCLHFGGALATVDPSKIEKATLEAVQAKADYETIPASSIVIYVVNPFDNPGSVRDVCACFWALFQAYEATCKNQSPLDRRPDIVLQILPLAYVASKEAPVVLGPRVLASLAREVYDRCPPSLSYASQSSLSIRAAPSVQLEETIPRSIQFKLQADSSGELLHDGAHLHVAYAISWDGNWLTAAWTDNFGKYQAMASYCLRGERTFGDVAKEVWQTTMGIIQPRKVTWRLSVARAGVMEREELEAWAPFISAASSVPLGTVLLSVNTSPAFSLLPSAAQAMQAATTVTPVSTPQGVSPSDPTANAATPSDAAQDVAHDPDAHLVDVTDDVWGVVLGHRLNNSHSLTEIRPCLTSGLLINKGGDNSSSLNHSSEPTADRVPQCAAYNILWIGSSRLNGAISAQAQSLVQTPTGGQSGSHNMPSSAAFAQGIAAASQQAAGPASSPSAPAPASSAAAALAGAAMRFGGPTIDPILREYLTVYRGLGMLARLRGMKGTNGGTVPWHIAAAMNGVAALEDSM